MLKTFFETGRAGIAFIFVCAVLAIFPLSSAQAQTTTFAQFVEQSGSQDFIFTNNSANGAFSTVSGGSPIYFFYQNISGLPAALGGVQLAHLTVTTTTTVATTSSAGNLTQPLNQVMMIAITRDTPAPVGTGSGARTNLLTAVITTNTSTPDIVGSTGGNSATLSATTPAQNVTFTSDFINFGLTTQRNFGFSFSSVTPALNSGVGGFLQSFTAAATGTFASNPPPTYAPPTAASVNVGGRILNEDGNGVRGARVILTEADGTMREAKTGSFGSFDFSGVAAGQSVTLTVLANRYRYGSQIVNVVDNATDVTFYPEP